MGEVKVKGSWLRDLEEFIKKPSPAIPIEAVILYGSMAKGLGGVRGDVYVLVIGDVFKAYPLLDRLSLLKLKRGRIETLGYTLDETP